MQKRILEISNPGYLSLSKSQLIISRKGLDDVSIPIEDIGIILLSNSQITITHCLLGALMRNNVACISCDDRHTPIGLSLPLYGHTEHAQILGEQIIVKEPVKKKLWQQIIKAKISNQAKLLEFHNKEFKKILSIKEQVKSGDTTNREAQAARYYWPQLFGANFKRDVDAQDLNIFINYGYSVMRAAVARAIVATGLNPTLGIFHSNKYNPFALADDLLEPLRPLVDYEVYKISTEQEQTFCLDRDRKELLLKILTRNIDFCDKEYPFFVALSLFASSFKSVLLGQSKNMSIPNYDFWRISQHVGDCNV